MNTVEFWSSVEYGTFLRGLVRELNAMGWKARQRYLVDEKEYRRTRGTASSIGLRLRSYLLYPGKLFVRVRAARKPAVLVVCTNTFYAPAVAMLAARRRGVPVINWVFDLYPDVLVHVGRLRSRSLTERFLALFTKYALRHAAANVFLGPYVVRRAEQRFGEIERVSIIPVGADGKPFSEPPDPATSIRPWRLLYCGNLGRIHDVATILQLIRGGVPEAFTLTLCGKGVGMDQVRDAVDGKANVIVRPSLDEDEWIETMRSAHIALVTFKNNAEGLGMPSKTYSAMVAGQAILAICPCDSDLAETIRQHDAGWVILPGDAIGLRTLLAHIAAHPEELAAKRQNAYRAGHEHYAQKVIAQEWSELLCEVLGRERSAGAPCAEPESVTAT